MRTLRFILQKEFRQIFRDPAILRIIFIMPSIQLLILPLAADYEVRNINLSVVDHDHSTYSMRLIEKITSSGYFHLTDFSSSYEQALKSVEKDKSDLVIEIPASFEKNLIKENESKLYLAVNSVNGVKGGMAGAYAANIIRNFNNDVRMEWIQMPKINPTPVIEITYSNWYNPYMNYKFFMVPGIMVVLLTMVGSFLSALNIVREKEIGTIEQLNVTPIKKYEFILGKMIPFWVLGMIVLGIGLTLSYVFYGIVPAGSYGLIFAFAAVYMLAVLGFGLLISTYSETQQQAMFISFFFMMIFILMGGLYTNIESMPVWAQRITWFNPVSYFIEVIRAVILKGSTFMDIRKYFLIMGVFAVVLNGWAIWNYRKTS